MKILKQNTKTKTKWKQNTQASPHLHEITLSNLWFEDVDTHLIKNDSGNNLSVHQYWLHKENMVHTHNEILQPQTTT